MRVTPRDSSCFRVQRVAASSSKMEDGSLNEGDPGTRSISKSGSKRELVRSQIRKMGPICKTRKRATTAFIQSATDADIDLDKQLDKARSFDEKDSMWLSSGSTYSPSLFFEERRLSSSLNLAVDGWLISWLSTLASAYLNIDKDRTLFDELRLNPEEAKGALKLEKTSLDTEKDLQENPMAERLLKLQLISLGNDEVDSSVTGSEADHSSCGQVIADLASCDNCLTLTPSSSSAPSQVADLDGISLLVSLVNLDDGDSEWISDTELEVDCFQSGFPSPSCRSIWSSEVESTPSSNASLGSEVKHEDNHCDPSLDTPTVATDMEDLEADEPLFWPFQRKLDWSSEKISRFFVMSPRNNTIQLATPQSNSAKSGRLKADSMKSGSKEGCRRRLEFGSNSTASKILEWRERDEGNGIETINPIPKRLRKSTKMPAKMAPLELEDEIIEAKDGGIPELRLDYMHGGTLKDDFAANAELPIEALLGLGEFDGHEGVDSEYNEDIFALDDSL